MNIMAILYYFFKQDNFSSKLIQGFAILIYLSLHLLIVGAAFL